MRDFFKTFFKGWNAFEYAFLVASFALPLTIGLVFKSGALEIASTITYLVVGLLYAKGKILGYFLNFAGLALYGAVAIRQHLYSEIIIAGCLTLPATIYGVWQWARNKFSNAQKGEVVKVRHLSLLELSLLVVSQVVMGVGYYFMLRAFHSELVLWATFSIATSFFVSYLLARRYVYALAASLINDVVVIGMWATFALTIGRGTIVMIVMTGMYLVIDVYGIISWHRLKKAQDKAAVPMVQ